MDFKRSIVFLLLAAVACRQQEPIVSTYSSHPIADPARTALAARWHSVSQPAIEEAAPVSDVWLYVAGHSETLTTFEFPDWTSAQPVVLPHRITLPNSPMWYLWVADTMVSAAGLLLDADDGAQAFVNSVRLERLVDDRFHLTLAPGDSLAVRVLNNAMAGGLRKADFASGATYIDFEKRTAAYRKTEVLVEQALRLHTPPPGLFQALNDLLINPSDELLKSCVTMLLSYPMLSNPVLLPKGDGFVLRWHSTASGVATVWAGKKQGPLVETVTVSTENTLFEVPVSRLANSTFYRIRQGQTWSDEFQVPAIQPLSDTSEFSFTIWADSQGGWATFGKLMHQTQAYNDRFSIGAGDLVANGSDTLQWLRLLGSLGQAQARFPFYLVPGNHDYDGFYDDLQARHFKNYVTTPSSKSYFAWEYGNCAFVAINPNETFPIGFDGGDQKTWLLNHFGSDRWQKATWRFVVLHQPPLSQGWPGYHGDDVVRDLLEPLYAQAGIDFVVAGHTHDYERLTQTFGDQKVHFLIVGGGGGGLEPDNELSEYPVMDTVIRRHHLARLFVHADSVHMEVRGTDQLVIDQIDFVKK